MTNNDAPRTARLDIMIPQAKKAQWVAESVTRHWTLTALIEVAVDEFIQRATDSQARDISGTRQR
jgi:hypothetical protein